jgi:HAD superfamily hydrolase (TIGR01549 family)
VAIQVVTARPQALSSLAPLSGQPHPLFEGVRFIYFDLDHTLWDHDAAEQRALEIVAKDNGWPVDTFRDVYRVENLRAWREMEAGTLSRERARFVRFERTFLEIGVASPTIEQLEQVSIAYLDHYVRQNAPILGAVEAVATLARHYPLGILSNGFAETQHRKLELLGIGELFRTVVLSDSVGAMKPNAAIFSAAEERAAGFVEGICPFELLYVGDNPLTDIRGAAACGWRTIFYRPEIGAPDHDPDSNRADGAAGVRAAPPREALITVTDLGELPGLLGATERA